jgi:small subunit ribosomal protein S15
MADEKENIIETLDEKSATTVVAEKETETFEEKPKPKPKEKIPEGSLKDELADFKPEEAIGIIVKLTNAGTSKSDIGVILRDQYGIPSIKILTGKTLSQILKDKNMDEEIPEDLLNLIRKSVRLLDHMTQNHKDFSSKRGYQLTVSKINRLARYYRGKQILQKDWRYTEERARLLVK